MSQKPFKVFYVTDIHGSEICWRKFLNQPTSLTSGDVPLFVRRVGAVAS